MKRESIISWVCILLGAIAIGAGARISWPIPGSDVPITMQTLAVVLVGAWLGCIRGLLSTGLYVVAGGFGLPWFSDGASGWAVITGPTGGYLLGFVAAAALVGSASDRGWFRRWWHCPAWMLAAHSLILAIGFSRLSAWTGAAQAFSSGVAPFLIGAVIKSGLGAGLVTLAARIRGDQP